MHAHQQPVLCPKFDTWHAMLLRCQTHKCYQLRQVITCEPSTLVASPKGVRVLPTEAVADTSACNKKPEKHEFHLLQSRKKTAPGCCVISLGGLQYGCLQIKHEANNTQWTDRNNEHLRADSDHSGMLCKLTYSQVGFVGCMQCFVRILQHEHCGVASQLSGLMLVVTVIPTVGIPPAGIAY